MWVGGVVAVVGSGAAVADAPRKGARYTGRTSRHRKVSEAKYLHQAPTIRTDGTFSYRKTYKNEPGVPGFDQVHTDEQTVTVSFTATAKE